MKTVLLIFLLVCSYAEASDTVLNLGKFSTGDLTGWKEQTLGMMKPKTTYALARDNDREVLVAHSTKSASGRIYALNLDPKEYQTLKWSWKIDHTIKKGDEKTKDGDDFAVRVYVLFPRGIFSKTRAISYVWANKLPLGEHLASPFTPNIITVAVDSGEEFAGRWTFHQRNIYEDYRNFFGEEPPKIGAVALMTDTDNTGESAVGYYGDITLVRSPKTIEVKPKDLKGKDIVQKNQKYKDPSTKGTKNGETIAVPSSDVHAPEKNVEESTRRENNGKVHQPVPTPAAPVVVPQPTVSK